MSKMPLEFEGDTEKTYDALISIIENNQGRLAPIIVGCDEVRLRERVIERYEREAKVVKIRPYRIQLDSEPSVRAELDQLVSREEYLQAGRDAVFTVLGADTLLRVKLRDEDEQSELEKFFGYLQWTREGLRSFPFPIVLWVSIRMLREMGRRAPDFWSWRKASFQFGTEDKRLAAISREPIEVSNSFQDENDDDDELFPPLDELLQELKELHDRDPDSPNLPTLYSKLGQVYAKRVELGEATDLELERSAAIEYFEKAIEGMRAIGEDIGYVNHLYVLGSFLINQSNFTKATKVFSTALEFSQANSLKSNIANCCHGLAVTYLYLGDLEKSVDFEEQSLETYRDLDMNSNIASCLHNIGASYVYQEEYQKAIDYFSQSIELERAIGDQQSEVMTLSNLGACYVSMGQYEKAIAILEEALHIRREFKNRLSEPISLINLGYAHNSIGNPRKAFDYSKEAVDISQAVGNKRTEALALEGMADALVKLERSTEALQTYQKAQIIFEEISLEYQVEKCKDTICQLNQMILAQSASEANPKSEIPKRQSNKKSMSRDEKVFFGFIAGITMVLLIWWLTKR